METALTLHLDQRLVERAQAHAARRGTSVSEIVADLLRHLPDDKETVPAPRATPATAYLARHLDEGTPFDYETFKDLLSPEVRRLIGSALPEEGEPADEEDYKRYLLEKYG